MLNILKNDASLWRSECQSLSTAAWRIRRQHAERLEVPVSMIPWRKCLLEAKAIEAAYLAKACWYEADSVQSFGYAFYASKPVPVRRSMTRFVAWAIVGLNLLLIV